MTHATTLPEGLPQWAWAVLQPCSEVVRTSDGKILMWEDTSTLAIATHPDDEEKYVRQPFDLGRGHWTAAHIALDKWGWEPIGDWIDVGPPRTSHGTYMSYGGREVEKAGDREIIRVRPARVDYSTAQVPYIRNLQWALHDSGREITCDAAMAHDGPDPGYVGAALRALRRDNDSPQVASGARQLELTRDKAIVQDFREWTRNEIRVHGWPHPQGHGHSFSLQVLDWVKTDPDPAWRAECFTIMYSQAMQGEVDPDHLLEFKSVI